MKKKHWTRHRLLESRVIPAGHIKDYNALVEWGLTTVYTDDSEAKLTALSSF